MSRVTRWWMFGLLFLLSMGGTAWVKWVDPYPSPGGLAVLSILLGVTAAGWVYLLLRRKSSRWPACGALAVVLILVWWSPLRLLVQGHPTGNADLYLRPTVEKGAVEYYWKPTDMTFRMPATGWRVFDEMPGVLAFCYKEESVPRLIFRHDPMYCYSTKSWEEFRDIQVKGQQEVFGNQGGLEVSEIGINRSPGVKMLGSTSDTFLQVCTFQLGSIGYGSLFGAWRKDAREEEARAIDEGMNFFITTVRSR